MHDKTLSRYVKDHIRDPAAMRRARAIPVQESLLHSLGGTGAATTDVCRDLWPIFKDGSLENLATIAFATTLRRNGCAAASASQAQQRGTLGEAPHSKPNATSRRHLLGQQAWCSSQRVEKDQAEDIMVRLLRKQLRQHGYYKNYDAADEMIRERDEAAWQEAMEVERQKTRAEQRAAEQRKRQLKKQRRRASQEARQRVEEEQPALVAPKPTSTAGESFAMRARRLASEELRKRRHLFLEAMRALDAMKHVEMQELTLGCVSADSAIE